jgi:predicted HAD superfamily phosphohydrolase YqeG
MAELRDFEEQAFDFSNVVIALDVDGTIVADCADTASEAVVRKVRDLQQRGNEVCLCSNSRRGDYAQRLAALGRQLGVEVCPVVFRKPSRLALRNLKLDGRKLVVIGDKDLTDGLLARRFDARFIKVRRKLDPQDRSVSKLANLFDDLFGPIALYLWDLPRAFGARERKG